MSDYMDIIFGALIAPKYNDFWIKLFGLENDIDENTFWERIRNETHKVGDYELAAIRMNPEKWEYLMIYTIRKNVKVEDFRPNDLDLPETQDFNDFCDYLGAYGVVTDKTEIKLCFKPLWPKGHPNNP